MTAKFPETTWPIWLSVVFITIKLVGLCRLSRGCYLLAVPAALVSLYNGWSTLMQNVGFREAMVQQLGHGYFVQYATSFAVQVMGLAAYSFYDFKYGRSRANRQAEDETA